MNTPIIERVPAHSRQKGAASNTLTLNITAAKSADMSLWPDALLVAVVRRDPPDENALDVLVWRHWKPLFARCHLLTLDSRKAADLAQETWCRLLRARCSLKPEGNFSGYLMTIAANLWRDSHRLARRAGAMADDQLLSLDQTISNVGGEPDVLGDMVHDSKASDETERSAMDIDLDNALGRLTPLLRDVLESRFINGESSAEIGDRYNRTEQCVTGWIRQAIREVKTYLSDSEFSE